MDQLLDPQEVEKARKEQLAKLWERAAFTPVHKSEIPFGFQIFSHKWVDKCSKGVHKSRFTCADVKRPATARKRRKVWTCLCRLQHLSRTTSWKHMLRKDRGATEGKPVYVRAPVEWHDLFSEWNPQERAWYKERFKEIHFRLMERNLFGRRTAQ